MPKGHSGQRDQIHLFHNPEMWYAESKPTPETLMWKCDAVKVFPRLNLGLGTSTNICGIC